MKELIMMNCNILIGIVTRGKRVEMIAIWAILILWCMIIVLAICRIASKKMHVDYHPKYWLVYSGEDSHRIYFEVKRKRREGHNEHTYHIRF